MKGWIQRVIRRGYKNDMVGTHKLLFFSHSMVLGPQEIPESLKRTYTGTTTPTHMQDLVSTLFLAIRETLISPLCGFGQSIFTLKEIAKGSQECWTVYESAYIRLIWLQSQYTISSKMVTSRQMIEGLVQWITIGKLLFPKAPIYHFSICSQNALSRPILLSL